MQLLAEAPGCEGKWESQRGLSSVPAAKRGVRSYLVKCARKKPQTSLASNSVSSFKLKAPLAFQVHILSEKELEVHQYKSSSRYKAAVPIFSHPHWSKRPSLQKQAPSVTEGDRAITWAHNLNMPASYLCTKYRSQNIKIVRTRSSLWIHYLQTLRSKVLRVWQIIAHFLCLHFCIFI